MIRETELLSLIVCLIFRIQFSWNHQCMTWHCESKTCFFQQCILLSIYLLFHLCWNDKIYPTRYKFTHGVWMYIYMSFKLVSLLPFTHRYYHLHWNWNLGKLRRSHFNMDGSQLWVVPMPPRNALSEKRENETGRLHYKVQNTNLPLCFLIIFNFLVKNLSNLPVMNIKHYQHAWD